MSKLTMPQMARVGLGQRIRQKHADERAEELAKQIVTVRCAFCRPFLFTGPVVEARERFAEHRATEHPELRSLEAVRAGQRKLRREVKGVSPSARSYLTRREYASEEELQGREVLRRETRGDLPPLKEEAA